MLRSIGASLLSIALVVLASSAFRQAVGEFRDTEPGSLLFGVLQLVIGSSVAAAAFGVLTRTRWAARAIGVGTTAAALLLVSQPFYEPMSADAQWSIWLGAAVVVASGAGMAWIARRLARHAASSTATTAMDDPRASTGRSADADRRNAPLIAPAPYAPMPGSARADRDAVASHRSQPPGAE